MDKAFKYLGQHSKLSLLIALTIYFVLPYQAGVDYQGGIITTILFAFVLLLLSFGLIALLTVVLKLSGIWRDDFSKREAKYVANPLLIVATAIALSVLSGFYPATLTIDGMWDTLIAALVLVSVPHWLNRTFRAREDDTKLVFEKSALTSAEFGKKVLASSCIFAAVFYFVFSHEQGFAYTGGLFFSLVLGICFSVIEIILFVAFSLAAKKAGLLRDTDKRGDVKPLAFSTLILCAVLSLHLLSLWFPNTLAIAGLWHLIVGSIVLIGVSSWIGNSFEREKGDTQPFVKKPTVKAA